MSNTKKPKIEKAETLELTLGGTEYSIGFDMKELQTLSQLGVLLSQENDIFGHSVQMFFVGTKDSHAGMNVNLAKKIIESAMLEKEIKLIDLYSQLKGYMADRASELGFI